MKKTSTFNVTEAFNESLVNAILNAGDNWECPWITCGLPANFKTGKIYNGANLFFLLFKNQKSRYFLTFNQVRELNGKVKKGAKSEMIIFTDYVLKNKLTGATISFQESRQMPPDEVTCKSFIKYYNVFSLDDIEGIDTNENLPETITIDAVHANCESIIESFKDKPEISHNYIKACYHPDFDAVSMPPKDHFKSIEQYYSTLFHELAHATGHDSRLRRKSLYSHELTGEEKHSEYALEELTAEITTLFLMLHSGLATIEKLSDSLTYLKGWVKDFDQKDKTLIRAAAKAQQAFNYILNEGILAKEILEN